MKIWDLKTNPDNTFINIECRKKISDARGSKEGHIELASGNSFSFVSDTCIFLFEIKNKKDSDIITDYINRHYSNAAYITQDSFNTGVFFLNISFFYSMKQFGKFEVTVTEEVKSALIERGLINSREDIYSQIKNNFVFSDGINNCFAYTTGNYYSDDDSQKSDKFFKIYGQDYSFLISCKGTDIEEMLITEKVDFSKSNVPSMVLAVGELKFSSHAGYVSLRVKQILKESPGYLDLWNKYAELEGEFLLRRARETGLIKIDRQHINIHGNYLLVYPEGDISLLKKHISDGDYLCLSHEIPVYLKNPEMTWREYAEYSSEEKFRNARIIEFHSNGSMIIDADDITYYPYISLSIHGDKSQILRREQARRMIENGESANPGLALIIEGNLPDSLMPNKREKKVDPLSDFVRNKIFKNPPTNTQIEAINIALNTPDIAIIQGPPGTGKTTVITAILERLNELADKTKPINGQVLVTSFQHDAVKNVIERLSINSLPTIKYGSKSNEDDTTTERAIEKWSEGVTEKLKEMNPSLKSSSEQEELFRLHNFYVLSPCSRNALAFLRYAKSINTDMAVNEEIDTIISELTQSESIEKNDFIKSIRRIRTTKEGFMDDGPEAADMVLEQIEAIIDRTNPENRFIEDTLEEAALSLKSMISEDLLCRLEKVKNLLLEKCTEKPSYTMDSPREDIGEIYQKVKQYAKKPEIKEEEILYALYYELNNNPLSVTNAVSRYNFVFASTTQQSVGIDIRRAKGQDKKLVYNTVVVDEAARVNPGDLMIPLAQAERRIILVGDHRQLPHIYDEEIFEELEMTGDLLNQQDVGITLFQHLMNNAKKLYEKDGIPRTITLDAQYRMHPLLGNFVNNNFYKQYGEGFNSPLPESHFSQGLYHKPLKWVNFSYDSGFEERVGTSRRRECEAEYIAEEIRRCINTKEGKNLSYGVVSFYSAQVNLIKDKLGELQDKVRVGSVDAFQGMEFDVIFLSVVRTHHGLPKDIDISLLTESFESNEEMTVKQEEYIRKTGTRLYGFLVSENRLCVSLSRQKKLLVVVGDGNIFHSDEWNNVSKKCVPAMYNLYKLCQQEGVIENGNT